MWRVWIDVGPDAYCHVLMRGNTALEARLAALREHGKEAFGAQPIDPPRAREGRARTIARELGKYLYTVRKAGVEPPDEATLLARARAAANEDRKAGRRTLPPLAPLKRPRKRG